MTHAACIHDYYIFFLYFSTSQEQVGYSWSLLKSLILYPLAAFPLGAGLLLAYWFPHVWVRLTCWRCPLQSATYVIIKVGRG